MTERNSNDDTRLSMDTELGRMVVDQKLATPDEVKGCLSIKATQAEDASLCSFAQILVDQGVVTARQIDRIKKTIEATRGQQIPGYQIYSKLGAGAMATVFKTKQVSLDRVVAVKVLPRKLSESEEYVERFYREGQAAAKLNHANIVQAIDVGEAGGYHYFVMEYVDGHALFEDKPDGECYGEPEALRIIIQVARALEHAHSHGLIHRDVKPKNIMIASNGVVKLADMGLARAATDAETAQAEAGRAYGTPYYISPEQIRGEVDIDFRADIYSLGATLYHLVTGRVPFEGDTPAAVMHKHLKDPLVPPDHINTELSAGLGEVVEVMMAKSRRRRYSSTSDLLVDLEAIADGQPPPIARRQIDEAVLSGLGEAAEEEGSPLPATPVSARTNLTIAAIALAVALVISILINVVLLAK